MISKYKGCLLGKEVIPDGWIEKLENSQKIEDLTEEMSRIFKEQPSEWLKVL